MFSQACRTLSMGGRGSRGSCVAGGHAWHSSMHGRGGMQGRGAYMAGGHVCPRGCVWWGGLCMAGGHAWQGACVAGGGMHLWQERWPLRWTVPILLECILIVNINIVISTNELCSLWKLKIQINFNQFY